MGDNNLTYVRSTRPIIPPYAQHPTLTTSNPYVTLRPFRIEDLAALHELRTQIEVMKWTSTGKVDLDATQTRTWMARFMHADNDLQNTSSHDAQTNIEKASNSSVKFNFVIVFTNKDPESKPSPSARTEVIGAGGCHVLDPVPEVGYMLRKEYWGRGIATAFLTAFLNAYWNLDRVEVKVPAKTILHEFHQDDILTDTHDSSDEMLQFVPEVLSAEIDATNIGSQKVLEKCGFRYQWTEKIKQNGIELDLAHYSLARR